MLAACLCSARRTTNTPSCFVARSVACDRPHADRLQSNARVAICSRRARREIGCAQVLARTLILASLVASWATCARCGDGENGAGAGTSSSSSSSTTTPRQRTASCDRVTGQSVCSEYSGSYLAQNEAVISSGCAKLGGAFVGAECPNTAVLGSCTLSTTEVRKFYASGGAAYDAARAQKECEGSYRGTWSALR